MAEDEHRTIEFARFQIAKMTRLYPERDLFMGKIEFTFDEPDRGVADRRRTAVKAR